MRLHIKRVAAAATAALIIASALSACAPTGDAGGGGDDKRVIGLLLPDSVTARYESADKPYFEAKVAELCPDCTVLYANADGDASKQQQQAESMITQGADVLVLDPFDGEAAASIVSNATGQGIPVIAYDRMINNAEIAYYVSFDNERVGELQAEGLLTRLDELGTDGGILVVNGSPTDNNAALLKTGSHTMFDASDRELLAEFDTPGWDPAKAQDWVSGQLTQFDNIAGVYAANDGIAGGVAAAFKAAGITDLPPVTGGDAELAAIQRILVGDQYSTIYKGLKDQAEKAAELAVALIDGNRPDADTTAKTQGGDDVPAFLLEPQVVTVENIMDTVVADKFLTVADICSGEYAAACAEAGIK